MSPSGKRAGSPAGAIRTGGRSTKNLKIRGISSQELESAQPSSNASSLPPDQNDKRGDEIAVARIGLQGRKLPEGIECDWKEFLEKAGCVPDLAGPMRHFLRGSKAQVEQSILHVEDYLEVRCRAAFQHCDAGSAGAVERVDALRQRVEQLAQVAASAAEGGTPLTADDERALAHLSNISGRAGTLQKLTVGGSEVDVTGLATEKAAKAYLTEPQVFEAEVDGMQDVQLLNFALPEDGRSVSSIIRFNAIVPVSGSKGGVRKEKHSGRCAPQIWREAYDAFGGRKKVLLRVRVALAANGRIARSGHEVLAIEPYPALC